jgi:hypothetical protein
MHIEPNLNAALIFHIMRLAETPEKKWQPAHGNLWYYYSAMGDYAHAGQGPHCGGHC